MARLVRMHAPPPPRQWRRSRDADEVDEGVEHVPIFPRPIFKQVWHGMGTYVVDGARAQPAADGKSLSPRKQQRTFSSSLPDIASPRQEHVQERQEERLCRRRRWRWSDDPNVNNKPRSRVVGNVLLRVPLDDEDEDHLPTAIRDPNPFRVSNMDLLSPRSRLAAHRQAPTPEPPDDSARPSPRGPRLEPCERVKAHKWSRLHGAEGAASSRLRGASSSEHAEASGLPIPPGFIMGSDGKLRAVGASPAAPQPPPRGAARLRAGVAMRNLRALNALDPASSFRNHPCTQWEPAVARLKGKIDYAEASLKEEVLHERAQEWQGRHDRLMGRAHAMYTVFQGGETPARSLTRDGAPRKNFKKIVKPPPAPTKELDQQFNRTLVEARPNRVYTLGSASEPSPSPSP